MPRIGRRHASATGRGVLAGILLAGLAMWSHGGEMEAFAERQTTIEAMLSPDPAGLGRRIDDRSAWERLRAQPAFAAVIDDADELLTERVPDLTDELYLEFSRTGNRTHWQRVNSRRCNRLRLLTMAECLAADGRFVGALREIIEAICAQRTWVMPAHDRGLQNFHGDSIDIDLNAASLAWTLATAEWLLHASLPADTRETLEGAVRQHVLTPFRAMVSGERPPNWWLHTTNNWNAVCLAGVTGAALALLDDRHERAFVVAAAEAYSENFLAGFSADGYCSEGLGYWNYGFGHYVLLAETIAQATGGKLDLLQRPQARAPAAFAGRLELQHGVYPAFADCRVGARPAARVMYFVSRVLGFGWSRWEREAVTGPQGSLYDAMLYSFPNSASRRPPDDPEGPPPGLRDWFEDGGVFIGRQGGTGRDTMAVALKGGHNAEHHNHNDVGSYVVAVGGDVLLADPGAEVYTARTFSKRRYESKLLNSWGHPVPVVAGQLQRTGRAAQGRVIQSSFSAGRDILTLDLSSAYEAPQLERLTRRWEFRRGGGGTLQVVDEAAFHTPSAFETALVTFGQWVPVGPGRLRISSLDAAVEVSIEADGSQFEVIPEVIDEDMHGPHRPTRLAIRLVEPVTAARVTITIRPVTDPDAGRDGHLRNGSFEDGLVGWRRDTGMSEVTEGNAADGTHLLRITDRERQHGSSVTSARISLTPGRAYALRGKYRTRSGGGVGVYLHQYDSRDRLLNPVNAQGHEAPVLVLDRSPGQWVDFRGTCEAFPRAAYGRLWIHSFNGAEVEASLDALQLVGPVAADTAAPAAAP